MAVPDPLSVRGDTGRAAMRPPCAHHTVNVGTVPRYSVASLTVTLATETAQAMQAGACAGLRLRSAGLGWDESGGDGK